ncbi:hypothetical protein [Clostridium sp.]|jgi:hypothetical protein|uniref:hypothetical protein n=1 Tax=Clostridium sp. TaxID=1506 RepID=UPI002FDCA4C5
MGINFNEKTWKEFLERLSSYRGTVTDYCRENNMSKGQFYYYEKNSTKKPVQYFMQLR